MLVNRGIRPLLLAIVLGVFVAPQAARAASILLGTDYLTTVPRTFFDFPGIGEVDFEGRPIGPGNTDTIVQRQADAILPTVGSTDTIPIEMVALSLQSIEPVDIGGLLFDVFVHLTPGTSSIGKMTINHEFADNGTPAPEGTFTSFFDLSFTVDLVPVGGGASQSQDFVSRLESDPAFWSHEPSLDAVLVSGLPGDQAANLHSSLPSGFNDFFIVGTVREEHQDIPGQHRARQATVTVPEPATLALFGTGLGWLWLMCRRRAQS